MTLALLGSIPFIIAKDILDDQAKTNGIKNYSDINQLREVLDKQMKNVLKSTFNMVPFVGDEKRTEWTNKLMTFYQEKVSKLLENLGQDHQFSELFKDLPNKLKKSDGFFDKFSLLVTTVGVVLKRSFLVSGRQKLTQKIATGGGLAGVGKMLSRGKLGGAISLLVVMSAMWLFNNLFGEEADKHEQRLKTAAETTMKIPEDIRNNILYSEQRVTRPTATATPPKTPTPGTKPA